MFHTVWALRPISINTFSVLVLSCGFTHTVCFYFHINIFFLFSLVKYSKIKKHFFSTPNMHLLSSEIKKPTTQWIFTRCSNINQRLILYAATVNWTIKKRYSHVLKVSNNNKKIFCKTTIFVLGEVIDGNCLFKQAGTSATVRIFVF